MLATQAQGHLDAAAAQPPPAAVVPDAEELEGDPLAPARGILFGAALGLVSIAVMVLLGWWLF